MLSLPEELLRTVQSGGSVAWTMLVETRGSTPQKSGAMMLVFSDGSQAGTLGGGCVEAEVKRRALQLIDQGSTEILTFHLDRDYGWDDGLICGGRMKMLVDPVRPGDDLGWYQSLAEQTSSGRGCTEVVVVDAEKVNGSPTEEADPSGPAVETADRLLFDHAGQLVATRGSGHVPEAITSRLKSLKTRPRPWAEAGLTFLPRLERCRLLIVGGGHVGQKVAELAAQADFDIHVVDDREEYCNPTRFPQAQRLVVGDIDTSLSGLEIDENTFCVIVTRGHNHDEEALYHLAETPARYVGMIGSKRKIRLIFDDLLREGISRDALARVHAPLGYSIGSQTVPEIAISIVAELIACRNLGGVPERPRPAGLFDEDETAGDAGASAECASEPEPA